MTSPSGSEDPPGHERLLRLRRNHDAIAKLVQESEGVLLSTVVAGELLFGFRNGSRYEANVGALAEFLEDPTVPVRD